MFHCEVVDDYIVICAVTRKFKDIQSAQKYIEKKVPNVKVYVSDSIGSNSLYEATKSFVYSAETLGMCDWFISTDEITMKAMAAVSVIERERLWKVLMSETEFTEWIKQRVR